MSAQDASSARAILYAFVANLGIAIAKTWAAIYTGSGAILAEAIHSYADTGNQVLLYLGLVGSRRPPDDEHPMGYGKLTYFWSFVVAIMLFSLGGLFSIYEGWHKLQDPQPLNQAWVGLLVLGLAVVLEAGALAGVLREIRKLRGARPLGDWVRHTRNAELMVVLGEDLGALLGLALAIVFLSISVVTGDPMFDALGSICIGVVLVVISIFVGTRIRGLIVGRSAEPELREIIDEMIADDPAIERVFRTITLQIGPQFMLAAKIKMRSGLGIDEAVERINNLEARLRQRVPAIGWCFMEPDIKD